MREFSVPAAASVAPTDNLADLVWVNAAEVPDLVSFERKTASGWQPVTARQFAEDVRRLAGGIAASGVRPGDRVGLMAKTRYEWTVADFAIWAAGGVTVPVYETSSAEQVQWILSDSGAVAVFVETPAHAAVVTEVRDSVPDLREVWQIDGGDLERLAETGATTTAEQLGERRQGIGADALATIIYTSGTTGRPKGCELTHGNLLFDTRNVAGAGGGLAELFNEQGSTLLFLPLAHVFARLIQIGCVNGRVRMGHTADVKNLLADLAAFQPTFILSVPRVFEKVYNSAKQKAHADGKGPIFDRAAATAIAYSEALDRGGPGLLLKLRHGLFDKLVYGKLRAALGGRVRYAVSGGAPLGARLGHFFRGVGVTVLEGYGLTETAAGATLNLPGRQKVGSVGKPIPGCSVRIAEDGEVLLKGEHIFTGYYHNEAATTEALEPDGWFHSGDIGELDSAGFLTITGRKKELIVTAGGKNVAPAVLEDRLRAHPLVSQCMVVGDNRPFVGCLVTIDPEALPAWKKAHGKGDAATVADLVDDADLRAAIGAAVAEANKAVSQAESIREFRILPVDFTEEGGQLTPTLKLKRAVVQKEFERDIEAIYS